MANRYWVGGSGTWDASSTANWSASSGGAAGASAPTSADAVFLDASSGTGATVTMASSATCLDCLVNKSDITLALSGNASIVNLFELRNGTINLNSLALSVDTFLSSNTNTRAVSFGGSGKIVVTGSGTSWDVTQSNFSCSGNRVVEATYSGSVSRTFRHGYGVSYTEPNAITLRVTAGTGPINIGQDGAISLNNLDLTGFAGTATVANATVYGNVTLSTNLTVTPFAGNVNFGFTFARTPGASTVTSNGGTFDCAFTINGFNGTVSLGDNLAIAAARTLRLTKGTLDGNGKNVSIGTFALGAGPKTLKLGSGTWTVVGSGTAWDANTNVIGLTVSASTGTINMNSASAKTFAGGAKTWPTLNQGGAGALTIQQSNTFANITNTVQPATITLTAGTTQTVSAFGVSGTSGNLITLNSSSAGSQATLSDSSGTNSVSFVSIKDINATGGATWGAYVGSGSVDAGNNTGWDFGRPPGYAIEFSPALRSFTERKHF